MVGEKANYRKGTVGHHRKEKPESKNKGNKACVQYKWYMWHLGIETANYYVVPAIKYKYIPDFLLCIPANRILMKGKLRKQIPWTTSASSWSKLRIVLPLLFHISVMVHFDLLLLLLGVWASVRPATCGEGLLAERWKVICWIWSKTAPGDRD